MFGTTSVYQLNSPYEPRSGAHQPYGWDQISPFYRRYKVLRAHYKLTVRATSVSSPVYWVAFRLRPPGETTTFTDTAVNTALERPGMIYSMPNPYAAAQTFQGTVDFPKLAGVTKQQFDADVSEYSAVIGANPSRIFALEVGSANSAINVAATVTVEIRYDVEFYQRATLALS
jgi:hypothetical protein